jgi:hypothetical protein
MKSRRAFPLSSALRLVASHGIVSFAALLWSPEACVVALLVSFLALLRYWAMASFAASLCREESVRSALAAGAWLVAALALAVGLAATARLARPLLAWAAAAALAGPLAATAQAIFLGLARGRHARLGGRQKGIA